MTNCQPSPAPWLTAARDKPVQSHISWPLCLAVLQPVLVPWFHFPVCAVERKEKHLVPFLTGALWANQLTRLKCFDIIKHYNNYSHNYYWSTAWPLWPWSGIFCILGFSMMETLKNYLLYRKLLHSSILERIWGKTTCRFINVAYQLPPIP